MISKVGYANNNTIMYSKSKKTNNQNNNISFHAGEIKLPKQAENKNILTKLNSWFYQQDINSRICIVAGCLILGTGVASVLNEFSKNSDIKQKTETIDTIPKPTTIVSSYPEFVEERSVIVKKGQTIWDIAEEECKHLYGENNYTKADVLHKVHYLAKLNNAPRGENNAYVIKRNDKFVLQEAGQFCQVTLDGLDNNPVPAFISNTGEAWAVIYTLPKTDGDTLKADIIHFNNAKLTPSENNKLSGERCGDERYLTPEVTNPQFRPTENVVYNFNIQ